MRKTEEYVFLWQLAVNTRSLTLPQMMEMCRRNLGVIQLFLSRVFVGPTFGPIATKLNRVSLKSNPFWPHQIAHTLSYT